jgi:hypothetical protein
MHVRSVIMAEPQDAMVVTGCEARGGRVEYSGRYTCIGRRPRSAYMYMYIKHIHTRALLLFRERCWGIDEAKLGVDETQS